MRITRIMGAVLLSVAGVAMAQAQERNPLNATAVLDMGGFFSSTDVRVRLDGQGGMVGDPVDLDDTFGFDRFERFRFDGLWRIKGKHSIRGTYFSSGEITHDALKDTLVGSTGMDWFLAQITDKVDRVSGEKLN